MTNWTETKKEPIKVYKVNNRSFCNGDLTISIFKDKVQIRGDRNVIHPVIIEFEQKAWNEFKVIMLKEILSTMTLLEMLDLKKMLKD